MISVSHRAIQSGLIATFFLVMVMFSPGFAEAAPPMKSDLMTILRVTLENQPDIKIGRLEIESVDGDVQGAIGRFDSIVFGRAYYEKNDSLLTDYEKTLFGYDADKSESTGLEVGVRKVFRNGFETEAAVKSIRVDDQSGLADYPTITRNVLEFSLNIPLFRGGGVAVTAEERQYKLARRAAEQRQQKIVSDAVAAAAIAYWEYLEEYKYLEIKKKIEQRTLNFLKNTTRLVELGERPSADLDQIRAQLAGIRSERIDAERRLYQAKQNLGLAMGISFSQIESLSDPVDGFPGVGLFNGSSLVNLEEFFQQALRSRGDYQAAKIDEESLKVQLEKDMDELKLRLDLKLSANFEGISDDNSYLDPSTEDESGPGGMILLDGEWPINNNSAKGAVVSSRAQQRQAHLGIEELERAIHSSIAVAVMDISRITNATLSSNEAVELYNSSVASEISKLKLGLSTLTNVISVEDKRNSAEEDLIALQSSLAKAVVRLRNETGTLVNMGDGKGELAVESIITLPMVEE